MKYNVRPFKKSDWVQATPGTWRITQQSRDTRYPPPCVCSVCCSPRSGAQTMRSGWLPLRNEVWNNSPAAIQKQKGKNGNGEWGSAGDTSDNTWILLKLSVPCPLRLRGAGEARCVAAQQLHVRRLRRVAPHAHLSRAALHLEQLPARRL